MRIHRSNLHNLIHGVSCDDHILYYLILCVFSNIDTTIIRFPVFSLLFLSDIQNIEILPEDETGETDPRRFDDLMGELLEGPYYIIDRFPKQVPGDDATANRYFPVHHYLRNPERMKVLRRKFAEILLRLNCYHEMAVSFDSCYSWEINPEPEAFADKLENFEGNDFLRVIFEKEGAMIDFEPDDDTCMTLFDPKEHLLELVRQLAASEGFFVWQPPTS